MFPVGRVWVLRAQAGLVGGDFPGAPRPPAARQAANLWEEMCAMKQGHIARVLAILACAILLSACPASDDTPPGLPQTGDFPLRVRGVGNWGNPLADALLYIT